MRTNLRSLVLAAALTVPLLHGQTAAPLLPASGVVNGSQPTAGPSDENGAASVLRALQTLKATNTEVLLKQEATLIQLEEIGKNTDQLRLFSRPGGMSR